MTVTLRWKEYKNGNKRAYLDIYSKGNRKCEYLPIWINKNDANKKELKRLAETIRTKRHNELIYNQYGLVSEEKLQSCFLKYYQQFLKTYSKPGIRKFRYAYEWFLKYLKHEGLVRDIKPSTIRNSYSTTSSRLSFKSLSNSLIKGYTEYITGTYSTLTGETPYDYFKRLKEVLNKAHKENYLLENPSIGIRIKKPTDTVKKQILWLDELRLLSKTQCGNEEVKRAFLFACYTGLGAAEIRKLRWKHLENGRLNITRAKNTNPITFKLPDAALKMAGEKKSSQNRVFNLSISDSAINKNLKNWIKKAGIDKHITFYCGRHSFAMLNLQYGTHPKTLASMMGHSDLKMVNKYLNYLDSNKDEAATNLPKL